MWLPFGSEIQTSLVALNHCPLQLGLEFELLLWRESHGLLSLAEIVLPYTCIYTQPQQYRRYRFRAQCNALWLTLLVCTRDTPDGVLASADAPTDRGPCWRWHLKNAREVTHDMIFDDSAANLNQSFFLAGYILARKVDSPVERYRHPDRRALRGMARAIYRASLTPPLLTLRRRCP